MSTIDWNQLIIQAPFFAGLLWLINTKIDKFLVYLKDTAKQQAEEREKLYEVIANNNAVMTQIVGKCEGPRTK